MKTYQFASMRPRCLRFMARGFLLGLFGIAGPLQAANLEWDIELTSMDLNATALLPLGPGWSPILTEIHIGESASLSSAGKAFARFGDPAGGNGGGDVQHGDPYVVDSFFDVFFDISVKDVDPSVNFGGGPTDGLLFAFPNNGPAHMQNFYTVLADLNLPNYGMIPPPEASPYIGHFNIEIPLGADLNGNGEDDKIKFTLVAHTVQDENRTFITLPDGTVIDNFDSIADLSGAVVDLSQDPPFGPISLTGPTTATSKLVPEPSSFALLATVGVFGLLLRRRLLSIARR